MHDKAYDHPIYSLALMSPSSQPEDEPRFAIPVPQGLLVAPAALRRQAEDLRTDAVEAALHRALGYHLLAPAAFAAYGLDGAWAENLRHWGRRMWTLYGERLRLSGELRYLQLRRGERVERGRQLWERLRLSAELAGLGDLLAAGPPPRAIRDLLDGLKDAACRATRPELRGRLAANGFGPAELAELQGVCAAIDELRDGEPPLAFARQRASDALVVLRAAVLGDLQRLGKAATAVLPPGLSRDLRGGRLLRERGRA